MLGNAESNRRSRPSQGTCGPELWPALPRDARRLVVGSQHRGYEWTNEIGDFCLLTEVVPILGTGSRSVQTRAVLDLLEALLDRAGFTFDHVLRTWFFLDDILAWYDDFNRVRTSFYSERGLLGRAPASTAVGVPNEQRRALKAHLLALRPNSARATVAVATSPLQGSAFEYGSAFSRGIRLDSVKGSCLYVSGTAAIDSGGSTLFPGDSARQIKETFRIVRALLEHHGFGFRDVTVATGYLPDPTQEGLLRAAWPQDLPIDPAIVRADICRHDLQFELELSAERAPC
jgi:enamine deaminase RidA (YjgF/YER057c/UK114 family)